MRNSYSRSVSILIGAIWVLSFALFTFAQTAPIASLRGTVTDPSGARVPNALVQIVGPQRSQQRKNTDATGQYSFPTVAPGVYLVRIIAKDFTIEEKPQFAINGPTVLDVQLRIEAASQVVNVEAE